jgi:hypothetical protein
VRFSFRSSIAKNPYLEDNIMKDIRFLWTLETALSHEFPLPLAGEG